MAKEPESGSVGNTDDSKRGRGHDVTRDNVAADKLPREELPKGVDGKSIGKRN
jgi:hypothetical protein